MKMKFNLKDMDLENVKEIHLITLDEDGNQLSKVGIEDIEDEPTSFVLEIKEQSKEE